MLTVVLVLQTPARQTLSIGVQRTVGTIVGVVAGMVIVRWLDTGTAAIVAAFVLAGFGMIAFKGVSYTLSTVFTTCVLLFSQRILQQDAFGTGWQRIGATLLGTAIALAVVLLAVPGTSKSEADAGRRVVPSAFSRGAERSSRTPRRLRTPARCPR